MVAYQSLNSQERQKLISALRQNSEQNKAMLMSEDTSFAGVTDDLPTDDEVISAVKSVPNHY